MRVPNMGTKLCVGPARLQIIMAREAEIQSCDNSSLRYQAHIIKIVRLSSSTGPAQQVDRPKWSFDLLSRLDEYAPVSKYYGPLFGK